MSDGDATWNGRRKRLLRCLANDLRTLLPLIGVAGCFLSSAAAIYATDWLPTRLEVQAWAIGPDSRGRQPEPVASGPPIVPTADVEATRADSTRSVVSNPVVSDSRTPAPDAESAPTS